MTDTKSRMLICSECYEPALLKSPREWTPAWGPLPPYSHWDGDPLCAVMTRDGYRSAEPKLVELP
ncbi:hypothetical protein FHX44_117817 [Pseudonocardia hierapolitana]|uniref:Uncharacterized protein n=1 Tax=Pseudonocardia hierapolitana TaxID=1128676 RepID=A0A561T451_9PSEU|nr:hypothetical protein [Pseudonocardia hierapolitana]TWF81872.1 hypothetical protein FHX44_117817 [Pseudonocardia hierapolitana]